MAPSLIGPDSTKIAEIAHKSQPRGRALHKMLGVTQKKRSCDSAVFGKLKVGISGLRSDLLDVGPNMKMDNANRLVISPGL